MKEQANDQSRRNFLKTSIAFGAFTILPAGLFSQNTGTVSPNEKINLAIIGIGNQGNNDRKILLRSGLCDVFALCDMDMEGKHTYNARYEHGLAKAPAEKSDKVYPLKSKGYTDFRVMFDEMADEIDAVLIATPDHSHFAAAMLAMSLGKHVYVEKPLKEIKPEWDDLFASGDFSAWSQVKGKPVSAKWSINDGVIHRAGLGASSIITKKHYKDFEPRLCIKNKYRESKLLDISYHGFHPRSFFSR